jgi:hypothetical protein
MHLCYRFFSSNKNYFVYLSSGQFSLWKKQYGDQTTLLREDMDIHYNEWHTVEVVENGGKLKVYFDDVLLFDYTDPEPILNGRIAFQHPDYGHVHIDDVLVKEVK